MTFDRITKKFGDATIIDELSAEVDDGEFLVLLGPSGCGKSTLLRLIAGLTDVSDGRLLLGDELANDWGVHRRGVAFVFQTYALYPHMRVSENISFPLVMERFKPWHHIPIVNFFARRAISRKPEVTKRTEEIASQLGLTDLMSRRPASLSGGQRQRVALARALVRDPSLYLLDEPLSNLDAKLRTQMRSEITELHKKVQKTFVYVTHDQVEAMTMATKIIILDKGEVQQIGSPDDIYARPANTFVARFVGSPPINLLPVIASKQQLSSARQIWTHPGPVPTAESLLLGIRPEKLRLSASSQCKLSARVEIVERLGAETLLGCSLEQTEAPADSVISDDRQNRIFVRIPDNPKLQVGDTCYIDYSPDDVTWFDGARGNRIDDASRPI
ncbi:ABC transporter ATP-binding protein [Brevibacterium aurantiacum]|uniref:ABC transporter ATP-binding protein n=1 Tax=Brevibacterium aurantiacum TaxID=273384 RepID=UPI001C8FBF9E|nr:ABC transporter ATP-binding protein [Brevibacterium aurantiacum]